MSFLDAMKVTTRMILVGLLLMACLIVCLFYSYEAMYRDLGFIANVFILLIAIVSILGALVIRSILKPLSELLHYSRNVSHGNYKATIDYPYNNEIGELASEISQMVSILKEKLGFAQGILNGITVPCVVSNAMCEILFVNQAVIDLIETGGKPADYIGMKTGAFFYNEPDRQTITGKVCTGNLVVTDSMTDVLTRKGNTLHCRIDASPVTDLDGKVIAGIALIADLTQVISQRKQAERQAEKISAIAHDSDDISRSIADASGNLSEQVDSTARSAADQEMRISEAASAMDEMNATIMEVAKNAGQAADIAAKAKRKAGEGAEIVNRVIHGIDAIQRESTSLKDDMGVLGKQAEAIGQIMNVISDIADQTNLLALNAAIEAARAGDAGRGFAVVADEVRKLAEKTMAATKEVGEAIQGIQQGARMSIESVDHSVRRIDDVTTLSASSGEALGEIVSLVEQTTRQVQSIAAASDEQSAASEEIARLLEDIHKLTVVTSEAMSQSTQEVGALAEQTQELKRLIETMQDAEAADAKSKALA